MKPSWVLTLLVVALGSPATLLAQTPPSTSDVTLAVTQARKVDAVLMRQYSWISRTEIIEQGQVKDVRIEAVTCGSTGQLHRSVVDEGSVPSASPRPHIAEHERLKVDEYVAGLRSLLDDYTLPRAGQVQNFMNTATTSGPDADGLVGVTGRNVVMPGDTFSMWVDPRKPGHGPKVQVSTSFDGDSVVLTAMFTTLPSGLNHVAYAEVTVPGRQISLRVHNFDFTRNN